MLRLLPAFLLAAGLVSAKETGFQEHMRPFLEEHCIDCHSATKQKGGVNLSGFENDADVYRAALTWERVKSQLARGKMPPEKEMPPPPEQRDAVIRWIDGVHATLDSGEGIRNPMHVGPRRLNHLEYNRTMHDLLGLDLKPADAFPADGGGGEGFDNNADTLFLSSLLFERYARAAQTCIEAAFADESARKRLVPSDKLEENIARFLRRAFRRPPAPEEIAEYVKLTREEADPVAGLRKAMQAALVSPHFLYVTDPDASAPGVHPVDPFALASRLSYFLWRTMPDDELLAAAESGALAQPEGIEKQTRRLLADPRAAAFAHDFARQWLGLQELGVSVFPSRGRFPEYKHEVQQAMIAEAEHFVAHIFLNNRPITELLDAPYTFVTRDLATFYGLPAVDSDTPVRVDLPDRRRGGVTTLGAVMAVTSYPIRTSPVKRGKWLLEQVLGQPPPPPPPDAGFLPAADKVEGGLTLRQRLESHRSKPGCISCHEPMDPLGFALENFDPVGRWRDTIDSLPVDASGALPDGRAINGVVDLKDLLLERREAFTRNLASRLLGFGLGRSLDYPDRPVIADLVRKASDAGGGSHALLLGIVTSDPFRLRNTTPATVSRHE